VGPVASSHSQQERVGRFATLEQVVGPVASSHSQQERAVDCLAD
jgi:hypothetical protein